MVSIEQAALKKILSFSKKLPHFPDGRINYASSKIAPVLTIFVMHKNKLLLLKRSRKVRTYKGKWNTVAGYLDEPVALKQKILEELREELCISKKEISSMHYGKPYTFKDAAINKTWLIHPVLVRIKTNRIKIDWEHTTYTWIDSSELGEYDIVPNLEKSLRSVL